MNKTIDQNDDAIYQRGVEDSQRRFIEWLKSLPKETANDLTMLFDQFAKEEDENLREEIVQTIQELVMPELMKVELRKEFELSHEDSYVRNNLSQYRRSIGREVKKLRESHGMSQVELAEKAGISQSHICRLETGVHVPTFATIERIAAAMDVSPSLIDPGFTED